MSRYRAYTECPDCRGARLRPEALLVRLGDNTIAQVAKMNIARTRGISSKRWSSVRKKPKLPIASWLKSVSRLKFLNDVGLEYLTLDRLSSTLSGGEAQTNSAGNVPGSRLVGATYVLDEPSIGLHSRDTARLTYPRRAARPRKHDRRSGARPGRDELGRSHHRHGPGAGETAAA